MILKLSDLQRSLDISLATTHGPNRIYLIVGQYCAKASESGGATVLYQKDGLLTFQFMTLSVRTCTGSSVNTASHGNCWALRCEPSLTLRTTALCSELPS